MQAAPRQQVSRTLCTEPRVLFWYARASGLSLGTVLPSMRVSLATLPLTATTASRWQEGLCAARQGACRAASHLSKRVLGARQQQSSASETAGQLQESVPVAAGAGTACRPRAGAWLLASSGPGSRACRWQPRACLALPDQGCSTSTVGSSLACLPSPAVWPVAQSGPLTKACLCLLRAGLPSRLAPCAEWAQASPALRSCRQ